MRPIHTLVWHCAATPEGKHFDVSDIDRWHRERGWTGIGYHKVILLDGRVQEGRPMDKIGAHVAGFNSGSIGYAYIGGCDTKGKPKDTRTPAQRATMLRLTIEAARDFQLKRIGGHNEWDKGKACPSFDVRKDELGNIPGYKAGIRQK